MLIGCLGHNDWRSSNFTNWNMILPASGGNTPQDCNQLHHNLVITGCYLNVSVSCRTQNHDGLFHLLADENFSDHLRLFAMSGAQPLIGQLTPTKPSWAASRWLPVTALVSVWMDKSRLSCYIASFTPLHSSSSLFISSPLPSFSTAVEVKHHLGMCGGKNCLQSEQRGELQIGGRKWRKRVKDGGIERRERKWFSYEVERERERRSAASEIDCFAELLTGVIVRASSVLVCTKYIFFFFSFC